MFGLRPAVLTSAQLVGRRYIDPGGWSFAIQIIITTVLRGLLSTRLSLPHIFWRLFGRRPRSESYDQSSVDDTDR